MAFDLYARPQTNDQGTTVPGQAPTLGLQPGTPFMVKAIATAGAGTALDISVTVPMKARLIGCKVNVVSAIAASVVQVFTAAAGGGTAATSAISTAVAGEIYSNLATASQVFAAGAIAYVRQSGGATLAGGEVYLTFLPEA